MTGQFPAAREHLERALRIDETVLGPNHPDVANDCMAMAELLGQMGQKDLAGEYRERATQIRASASDSRQGERVHAMVS